MRLLIALLFLSTLLFSQSLRVSVPEKSLVQIIVEREDHSVTPFGTGFFVSSDGTMATALHVYNSAITFLAEGRTGQLLARRFVRGSQAASFCSLQLITADAAHDIVLIKPLQKTPDWDKSGVPVPIKLFEGSEIEVGISVRVVGYFGADALPTTLFARLVGATTVMPPGGKPIEEFLISAFAVPGHSGSPVINDDGAVIGVLVAAVPVSFPFINQPVPSGLDRVSKVEHLKSLLISVKK